MADTPFGLSFGNPAKYMGQSPLAEAGKALKTGAILWGLQQTGAISALDKLGVKPNQAGGFSYSNPTAPTGSVPPMASAAPVSPVVPAPAGVQPVVPNAEPTVQVTPMSTTPPVNIGADILDGKYHGAFVDPQAQRDFNPYVPQATPNPVALTGNEYQQVPGYGKLAKVMQAFGGGMMG